MRYGIRCFIILLSLALVAPPCALAAEPAAPAQAQGGEALLVSAQLDQITAPIALYPDALLSQILMAATYPLDVVSAARWVKANPKIQGAALEAAMKAQAWDPSVKSLAAFPQVLAMMSDKLDWTQQLGNAFLAQPKDVMDSVQRLRAAAQAQGALKSNDKQSVSAKKDPGSSTSVIVIQPTQPDVIYVPAYNPTLVYGTWPSPAYPPYGWVPPGYAAAGAVLSFGLGVATGYALWGEPDWNRGSVNINVNHYTRFTGAPPPPPPPAPRPAPAPSGGGIRPAPGGDSMPGYHGGGTAWQHNPARRGNVPYPGHVADRFQPTSQGRSMNQDQRREQAREAFRGHTTLPAGQALGRGGSGERALGAPGERARAGDRDGLRHEQSLGGGGARQLGGGQGLREHAGEGGIRQHTGHASGNPGLFQGADGQTPHREFERGAQSRQGMRSLGGGGHGGNFRR